MRMTRRIWTQLAILLVIAATAAAVMIFGYIRLPMLLFGVGHYRVSVQLPQASGLYARANVTYRGSTIGEVKNVDLTDGGVTATLSLRSDVSIPSDLQAEVHSTSAVGEQYVALLPHPAPSAPLKDGDVITAANVRTPPDINALLDATNRGLQAIPGDDLTTAIDEAYTAVGGLGPDLNRLIKGSTRLAIDARTKLPDLLNVVDNVAPVLDTQTGTASSVQAWAAHLNAITRQLADHDNDVQNVIRQGGATAQQISQLFDQLKPTLPILAANLASVAPVLVTYAPNLEQLLVLLPYGIGVAQAITLANRGTKQDYKGAFLSFNLNVNLPPPCTTGFLPPQQQRNAALQDYPDRPTGDLYCRVPQDSPFNVRGVRNIPCETRPGKRAPTVKMCESNEDYVPLNDGLNWKGDPNATLSGQPIPQQPPAPPQAGPPEPQAAASGQPAPPIGVAHYDPATGSYVGPDGRHYTQADLAPNANNDRSWQSMLLPPGS